MRVQGSCRSCEDAIRDAVGGYAMCGGCDTIYIQNYGWRVADQTEVAHIPPAIKIELLKRLEARAPGAITRLAGSGDVRSD